MDRSASIKEFIHKIERLPSDEPVHDPRVWYTTQKEHWLGWLHEYDGPGAYGRTPGKQRDAKFAHNHIVEPKMLLWLIETAGVSKHLVKAAQRTSAAGASLMEKSRAIGKCIPWALLHDLLWNQDSSERMAGM